MKKYRIGGSKGALRFITTVLVIMIFSMLIPMGMLASEIESTSNYGLLIPLIFVFPGFIGLSIYCLVLAVKSYQKGQIALSGYKSKGVVTNNYITSGRGGSSCNVEIQYKTESGEDALFTTQVRAEYQKYFLIGKEIPLYVKGEYGYFKEEEIYGSIEDQLKGNIPEYKLDNLEQEKIAYSKKIEKKDTTCPYCGATLKGNVKRCPSCRSSLL